jgi:Domain of unknown function (DUF4440)
MGPEARRGARTPEELETLLEDAFVLRDGEALAPLFEAGAVLAPGDGPRVTRGRAAIARAAAALWARDRAYVAAPWRVLQARDTALVVGRWGIHVVRRGRDGAWRYAISLLCLDEPNVGGEP